MNNIKTIEMTNINNLRTMRQSLKCATTTVNEVYVFVHRGKHESVDEIMVKKFATEEEADAFINKNHSPNDKYYTCCTKINLNQMYEVSGSGYDGGADCW